MEDMAARKALLERRNELSAEFSVPSCIYGDV